MIVVTSKEFRDHLKKFLDLAKVQRVIIKQKNQFVELVPRGETIPENLSPSNNPYFDFSLICEYFSNVERQGPGSPEATLKALSFIDNLTDKCIKK